MVVTVGQDWLQPRTMNAGNRDPEGSIVRRLATAGTAMSDSPEACEEGFYWVILGQNPPEIAYWERGEWWLAGDAKPWQPEAVTVVSDRLVFRPRLTPVA
jgi:hypothetical protein